MSMSINSSSSCTKTTENKETIDSQSLNFNKTEILYSSTIYCKIDNYIRAIVLYIIMFVFLIISILTMIYDSIKSFFFLLGCSLKKFMCLYCRKRKKMPRCESGFLTKQNEETKLTLVIDLDNTLICSTMIKIENAKNYTIIDDNMYVYKRPYVDIFLTSLSQFCELVIYTAGTQNYAEKIIDNIDRNNVIKKRFYRHDCNKNGSFYLKDASICQTDDKRILIIDDNPFCHTMFKGKLIIK